MRAAICDDDQIFAFDLRDKLKANKKVRTIDLYTKEISAKVLAEEGYDVIFMDIDLESEKTGIHIASELFEMHCPAKILFMTLYTEKFVQQIFLPDTNVEGFLIKPVSDKLLEQHLEKILERGKTLRKRILRVKSNGSDRGVPMDDIMYIGSGNHVVDLYMKEKIESVPGNLKDLEKQLPADFARCQKCYIVNMRYIKVRTAQKLVMEDDTTITIGRFYSNGFREKYQEYVSSKL